MHAREFLVVFLLLASSSFLCMNSLAQGPVPTAAVNLSSGIGILSSGEGGQSFVMYGAGALSTTVLLSLVYVFMKKS